MRNISFKQFLTVSLLAIPAGVVAVGTEGCPPGMAGFMIGDAESLEAYTSSLYQRLGGGAKLKVNAYSNSPNDGDGAVLPGYGNKKDTFEKFSTRKVVIVEDNHNTFGIGVSKRSDAEAAAYLQSKNQAQPGKNLRRKLEKQDEAGDSGIGLDDILRFDFDGIQLKTLGVRISDLPKGESGTYRAYLDGKKVMESTFQGEDRKGFVEFTIEANILFDTIEFTSNVKSSSGYLISYMEYCKTQICTGKVGDVWGDPHVESYDGLDWNCQGAGIFLLLDGEQANDQYKNFQIQAHFDKSPWSDEGQITVTRAIAIDSGEPNVPVVQLTAPWNEKTNQCKDFKFYIDGVEKPITAGTGRDDKVNVDIITGTEGKTYVLTYPDKGVQVSIDIWPTDDHGCLIDAGVCLGEYWKQPGNVAKGLLGGFPNDVTSDDWVDRAGNPVEINMDDRKGKTAYDFCVANWCVKNEMESIFKFEGTTRDGKTASFSEYNMCGDSTVVAGIEKMEKKIKQAKQNPNNVCSKVAKTPGKVEDCLLESVACSNANKCVDTFVKQESSRVKRKEKEGKYEPPVAEKAVKYSAGSAKKAPPKEAPTSGGPMDNCGRQQDCIAITSEETVASKCPATGGTTCEFKVCMKVDQSSTSCVKSGSVSHTCVKSDTTCQNDSNSFAKVLGVVEKQSIPNGFEQCQYAGPGQHVQFLLKDGSGCDANGGGTVTTTLGGLPGTCRPRNSTTTSCTGNGLMKECIWEFVTPMSCTLPSPTAPITPTSPTTASLPKKAPKKKSSLSPAGAKGDPHIKTWDGEEYDYHGICDLVLLHNPEFHDGLGMDIHIRTKKTRSWSYISTAALRIGEDTFEVMAQRKQSHYWINGLAGEKLTQKMTLPMTISSFPINYRRVNSQQLEYVVDLGTGEKIVMKTWNNFVRVDVVDPTIENFGSSVGLMGTFSKSLKVGRDNITIIQDLNTFGQEWQVLPTEPKLFHNIDGPQAPERCEIPAKKEIRRRLAESEMSREDAEFACAEVKNQDEFDLCVFDVIATSDLNVAGAY